MDNHWHLCERLHVDLRRQASATCRADDGARSGR